MNYGITGIVSWYRVVFRKSMRFEPGIKVMREGKFQKRPRCWKAERVLYYGVSVGEGIRYQCWHAIPLRELSRNAMLGGMVGEVLLPLFQGRSKPGCDP